MARRKAVTTAMHGNGDANGGPLDGRGREIGVRRPVVGPAHEENVPGKIFGNFRSTWDIKDVETMVEDW